MKHLKLYESFNKEFIHEICKKYGIKNYTINDDGSIDVDGNVNLINRKLTKLPLKFNNINEYFSCSVNNLSSLEGCPKSVNGSFYCSINNLTSLKGCPESIRGDFYCHYNNITTFEYLPKHIDSFECLDNPIFEIWILFMDTTKIELFNDMDIIQDGIVLLERLNYFLEEIGKTTVKSLKEYKYI